MSPVSSTGNVDDELDDDIDEPFTTSLDTDETGATEFEEKSNEPMQSANVTQYWDLIMIPGDKKVLKDGMVASENTERCPVREL